MSTLQSALLRGLLLLAVSWTARAVPPSVRRQDDEPGPAECAPVPSASNYPTWEELPLQTTMPDPFLPLSRTTLDNAGDGDAARFAEDVMAGRAAGRVRTSEEWYRCRRPELLQLLQEYQFGWYPDHAQETVRATRSGNTVAVEVAAGGKTGRFNAQISLPAGASAENPVPAVINIGGMQSQPYLQAGIAVVGFDYQAVAPDSNSKTGAFWALYNGRDIGTLTAWAWGFHRTMDALNASVAEIDVSRVGVTGCSRLGKAALAAGLFDSRVALTMPMSSGVQGLGPYRYHALSGQDETLENSKAGAPWWSNSVLGTFVDHAENLPFDAHSIAAAIAPRALVIDQGTGDPFVNSKGTSVIVYPAAKAVYEWLGVKDQIGISVRGGGHCDMSGFSSILPFVTKILQNKTIDKDYDDLGSYGDPMTTAYPWATAIPTGV